MGTDFLLEGDENVLELDRAVGLHNTVNVPNATELFTSEWLILCYANLT